MAVVLMALGMGAAPVWAVPGGAAARAPEPDPELTQAPSWSIPSPQLVRERMRGWIAASGSADPTAVAAAEALWAADAAAAGAPADLLDTAMQTFALIDPRCTALRVMAEQPHGAVAFDTRRDAAWLITGDDASAGSPAAFQRDTVRLWLGRHFVRHDQFDEGLEVLTGLDLETAIDPAALLFHRAACEFWLLDADAAIESLDTLLERAGAIPVRYERTARLLRADIASLEDDSLDHIARRMRDITRRLDLGRAGPKTRSVQNGVIASLDKLIKKIEDEQSQCQCQSSSGAGGSSRGGDGTPMDDSRIAGGKGPGEVRNRDLGDGDGWGNLPPHQREEALQQIGREFPAHYREAIEQYFKRLASGGNDR